MFLSQNASTKSGVPKLDLREEHFRVPSPLGGRGLFLRLLRAQAQPDDRLTPVLYVHGGTFPSALSIAHRFDDRSWRDELTAAGFDVWGLDFHGFGFSDPYPEMAQPSESNAVLGSVETTNGQLEIAIRFICAHQRVEKISLIAHSWGSIVAGRVAGACPDIIDRLVFFGPITRRPKQATPPRYQAWRLVSLQDQWERFTADVPSDEPPVLSRRHFDEWGERYLDTDAESRTRSPASVKIPSGPWHDIGRAWAGELPYDPSLVRAPVAILHGEWDNFCTGEDAHWLFDALKASPIRRGVKISRATHLMHLEASRYALYRETELFLLGHDVPPGRQHA